jgi:V8-like Glu-specific endopeptidase
MFITKLLIISCFANFLAIFSHALLLEENVKCVPLDHCAHLSDLTRPRRNKSHTTILMNLLHCYYDQDEVAHIKCFSTTKLQKILDKIQLLPDYEECGLEGLATKISGGERTEIDEFPWIVLLKYRTTNNKFNYGCHGNLINNRYVLTAAHCVDPQITLKKNNGNVSSVVLGEYDISNNPDCITYEKQKVCADEIKELQIAFFHIHPNYIRSSSYNDIALIRLESNVEFTEYIKPICLPPNYMNPPNNETLWIAGWGSDENDVMNQIKVKAKFVLKTNTCGVPVNSTQYCAGSTENARTCPGDSGGPLMLRKAIKKTNRYFLIGVDSLGVWRCGTSSRIAIYTKVPSYMEWIVSTIDK